jgi:hypothetical protein
MTIDKQITRYSTKDATTHHDTEIGALPIHYDHDGRQSFFRRNNEEINDRLVFFDNPARQDDVQSRQDCQNIKRRSLISTRWIYWNDPVGVYGNC